MQRRSFLAVTSAGVTALAGCSGLVDGGGGGESNDGVGATTRWGVPASGPDEPLAGYELRGVRPTEILDAHDAIAPEDVGDRLAYPSGAQRHLDVRDVEQFVEVFPEGHRSLNAYVVFEGAFDATAVIETLGEETSAEVERVGTHAGYDLYDSNPGFGVLAVGDGTIVEADSLRNDDAEPADLESVVDAASGETDPITDQHEGLGVTADRLEPSHHVGLTAEDPEQSNDLSRGEFTGAVTSGMDADVLGAETELRTVVTFESEQAREAAPTDQWIEEARARVAGELSSSTDGRFLEVTVTVPTSELYG